MGRQPKHHADGPQAVQRRAAQRPGRGLHRGQGWAAGHRGGQLAHTVRSPDGHHPRAGQAGAPGLLGERAPP
eukprot:2445713-Pyramimonas_sp.AAC.1